MIDCTGGVKEFVGRMRRGKDFPDNISTKRLDCITITSGIMIQRLGGIFRVTLLGLLGGSILMGMLGEILLMR